MAMSLAGIDTKVLQAHATRGAGLKLLRQLGVSVKHAAETGSWKNYEAFQAQYSSLGASDVCTMLERVVTEQTSLLLLHLANETEEGGEARVRSNNTLDPPIPTKGAGA